jgi:AGZA family xanthine/uracil permease-like MFS transporter
MRSGDFSAVFGVFFDSFAKIAISVSVLINLIGLSNVIVYQKIMPGVCVSLALLNFSYYLQAKLMAKQTKIRITAIPSGLQASCVFVWLFAIMLPIATKTHNPILAYEVALVANLINAVTFSLGGVFLYRFRNLIPQPALLGSLAGCAFTWLTVNNIGMIFNHPISGVLPLIFLLAIFIGNFRLKVSPVLVGIILGSGLALCCHEIHPDIHFSQALYFSLPTFSLPAFNNVLVMHYVLQYLPLIVSFALIDAVSAVQIMEETKLSQDNFRPYQSILISGIISGASAFLGNPFAMALFFGHASWKKIKATHNYAFWVSLLFILISLFGFIDIIIAYVPDWVTLPILIFIGTSTTSLCFANIDPRYYSVLVVAIVPILIEMTYNKLDLIATQGHLTDLNSFLGGNGVQTLAKGSVLFSIGFASFLVYLIERKWGKAALISLIMLILSGIGFIHAVTPGFYLEAPMNIVYVVMLIICGAGYFINKGKVMAIAEKVK